MSKRATAALRTQINMFDSHEESEKRAAAHNDQSHKILAFTASENSQTKKRVEDADKKALEIVKSLSRELSIWD